MVFLSGLLLGRRLSRRLKRTLLEASHWDHDLYGPSKTPDEGKMKGLMKGMYPVTRTLEYLRQGIIFRDCVKVMTVHYGTYAHSEAAQAGIREVINMNISQMRFRNPDVHIQVFENVTPTPYITFYLEDGEKFHVDVDGKKQFEILAHLQKVVGKPKKLLEQESEEVGLNPANFGQKFERKCMCTIHGQVPCSRLPITTPGYALALHMKHIVRNPKKNPFGKEE